MTMENPLIFYRKFIFSDVLGCHVIVFQVATDFWDSILNLYFWNILATVIKKLLFFFLCVVVNAQILLKEVDPENLFRSCDFARKAKKIPKNPGRCVALVVTAREKRWRASLCQQMAWRSTGPLLWILFFFQRHMCHVDIMQDMYRYVPWQTLSDIFISKEQV